MARVIWDVRGRGAYIAATEDLFYRFGDSTAADYARLIEEGEQQLAGFPEPGSPTLSNIPNRRVLVMTNPKNKKAYKIAYDYDPEADVVTTISVSI